MIYEIFLTGLQCLILFLWVRSAFNVLRVRKDVNATTFILLIASCCLGFGLTAYNLSDPEYVLRRFPFNLLLAMSSAWIIYVLTKEKKKDLFTISNIRRHELSVAESSLMRKITDDEDTSEVEIVTSEHLEVLEIGVPYVEKKYILQRNTLPKKSGIDFKFSVEMAGGAKFREQVHPKMDEEIHVDSGEILDRSTGYMYKAGEIIYIPAGEKHWIVALTRVSISAYLTKVDLIINKEAS